METIIATVGEITLETIFEYMQAGALVTFLVLFIRGDVMSKKVVDQILSEAESRSTKLVQEISKGIEEAVYRGHLKADDEIKNGRKK